MKINKKTINKIISRLNEIEGILEFVCENENNDTKNKADMMQMLREVAELKNSYIEAKNNDVNIRVGIIDFIKTYTILFLLEIVIRFCVKRIAE